MIPKPVSPLVSFFIMTQYQPPAQEVITTESNSVSSSENVSSNAASLNSYQVNSNHESNWYRFANNTSVPGTSIYGDLSFVNNQWQSTLVASVGIRHTFGGRAKRLALESVALDNMARELSICNGIGVFDNKVDIDYSKIPDLESCKYVSPISQLKASIKEYKKQIEVQQNKIKAFELRLEQMQITNKM